MKGLLKNNFMGVIENLKLFFLLLLYLGLLFQLRGMRPY